MPKLGSHKVKKAIAITKMINPSVNYRGVFKKLKFNILRWLPYQLTKPNYPRKITYVLVDILDIDKIKEMSSSREDNMIQSDVVSYATAFAQIKITDSISSNL
ncbi:unnamed protein product [Commensalibacter communis]|nr:unnamed protein product [Commensalibacter communis]